MRGVVGKGRAGRGEISWQVYVDTCNYAKIQYSWGIGELDGKVYALKHSWYGEITR